MSQAACKKRLAAVGLHVTFEADATIGHEFVVEDAAGNTVAVGWHEGTKSQCVAEVLAHPAVAMRLARGAA